MYDLITELVGLLFWFGGGAIKDNGCGEEVGGGMHGCVIGLERRGGSRFGGLGRGA